MDAFGERGADRPLRRCAARRRTRPSLPGSRSRTCTRCGRAGWGRRCGDGLDGVEPGNAGHGVAEHPAVALSLGDLVLALTPRLCGAEAVHEEVPVAPGHRRVEKPSLPEGRQLPVPVRRLSGARAHQGDRIGRPAALRGGGQTVLVERLQGLIEGRAGLNGGGHRAFLVADGRTRLLAAAAGKDAAEHDGGDNEKRRSGRDRHEGAEGRIGIEKGGDTSAPW